MAITDICQPLIYCSPVSATSSTGAPVLEDTARRVQQQTVTLKVTHTALNYSLWDTYT